MEIIKIMDQKKYAGVGGTQPKKIPSRLLYLDISSTSRPDCKHRGPNGIVGWFSDELG